MTRLSLIVLALTSLLLCRTDVLDSRHPWFGEPWDHHKYIYMAEHGLLDLRVAPFCWRIGLPALVKALPLPVETAFRLIAFASVIGAALVCARAGRALGYSRPQQSFVALSVVGAGWAAKGSLANFHGTDGLALFLLCTGLWLIVERRWIALALLLVAGVCVKESVLALAPLAYTLVAPRLLSGRDAARALLVSLPALLVLIGLRWLHPALNSQPEYMAGLPEALRAVHGGATSWQLGELLVSIPKERIAGYVFPHLGRYTFYPFGLMLSALAVVGAWTAPGLALRLVPLGALAYAQLLVAVNTERLLVLAFPGVLVLAARGLRRTLHALQAESSTLWWTLPLGQYGALLLSPPSYGQNLALHLAQLAGAVVAVCSSLFVFDRRARSRTPGAVPTSNAVKGLSDGAHVAVP